MGQCDLGFLGSNCSRGDPGSISTGDIVGFLHADDLLASPTALSAVAEKFSTGDFDAVYADLFYVDAGDTDRVV